MAILTLALGIGANTAVFSVVNAVMLRPLPYPRADRLVRIWESNPDLGRPLSSVSDPNFLDWRAQTRAFSTLAASQGTRFTLTTNQGAEIVDGERVTADFLTALGISPALGRNFSRDEERPGGNVRVAIVSDGFWRRALAFGSVDPRPPDLSERQPVHRRRRPAPVVPLGKTWTCSFRSR